MYSRTYALQLILQHIKLTGLVTFGRMSLSPVPEMQGSTQSDSVWSVVDKEWCGW